MFSSLRQFPVLDGIRFGVVNFVRRFFDRESFRSYSQAGEDRILQFWLEDVPQGFYVEVGSNAPIHYSNTFAFYRMGWRGITVDANQGLVEQHKRLRKRDTPVYAAVSDVEEEVVFTEFAMHEISTIDRQTTERTRQSPHGVVVSEKRLRTVTLTSILDQHLPPATVINFLSIDVEGHDFPVLRSLDLSRYRPNLIVIEMHNFRLETYPTDPIYKYLTERGYVFLGHLIWNGYFADQTFWNSKQH